MDEWDEFLAKAEKFDQAPVPRDEEMIDVENEEEELKDAPVLQSQSQRPTDLGDFEDNAEILMQAANGESLNSLLSPNGLWIKSHGPVDRVTTRPPAIHYSKKRTLKSHDSLSVPVANTLQDLSRAVVGHPILSHPLSLLKHQNISSLPLASPLYEIDSIGIFFYGTVGDVKIESNVEDDLMKAVPLKKKLVNTCLINHISDDSSAIQQNDSSFPFIISYYNLKILADSLPPSGKSAWIIPFSVKDRNVDLSVKGVKSDQLALLYDYLTLSARRSIEDLLEPSIHVVSFSEGLEIAVKTVSPALSVSINFRGAFHPEPAAQACDFLFSRQANYSVEVDFENGPLRCTAIKSFVPKFDSQNRLFLLLKALATKLPSLPDGDYFLAHPANTPIIKILANSPAKQDQQAINFDVFIK